MTGGGLLVHAAGLYDVTAGRSEGEVALCCQRPDGVLELRRAAGFRALDFGMFSRAFNEGYSVAGAF